MNLNTFCLISINNYFLLIKLITYLEDKMSCCLSQSKSEIDNNSFIYLTSEAELHIYRFRLTNTSYLTVTTII